MLYVLFEHTLSNLDTFNFVLFFLCVFFVLLKYKLTYQYQMSFVCLIGKFIIMFFYTYYLYLISCLCNVMNSILCI